MQQLYRYNRIFTGEEWLLNHTVTVEDGVITGITPNTAKDALPFEPIDGILAPALIDIQLYGAYGKLLSVYPNKEALSLLQQYCSEGGALHFMPTVATNTYDTIHQCIDAIRDYWKEGGKGCLGLHIEGPWLNKQKRGAHIESLIHVPSLEEVKALLDYGKEVIKIITIAPEVCSEEVIQLIQSYGIVISAGHSNATYEEAMQAFNGNIHTATHLYNAMSPLLHRSPGMVGAIFDHPTVMSSIVPDGYHVDFAAVRIAAKQMPGRLFVITDAVTETTSGPYPHQLAGDKYESNGILSGSALTMIKAVRNMVQYANVTLEEALRMGSLYPARALGIDNRLGKIAKGYKAAFIALNEALELMPL